MKVSNQKKVEFVCSECGGTDVENEGCLEWIVDGQYWNFTGLFREDAEWCNDCNEETMLVEKEVK